MYCLHPVFCQLLLIFCAVQDETPGTFCRPLKIVYTVQHLIPYLCEVQTYGALLTRLDNSHDKLPSNNVGELIQQYHIPP
jgi:hypothetical protein